MNKKIMGSLLILSVLSLNGISNAATAASESATQPATGNIVVTVKGMVCSFCAQGITKKFKALPEVEAVDVRIKEAKVYITTRKGMELPDQKITDILTEAGYNVGEIKR